jgi:hypothetical protein
VKKYYIYKVVNPAGHIYIGCTSNPRLRRNRYNCPSDRTKKQRLLYKSILDYGFKNHTMEVIDEFIGNSEIREDKEMFWIRTNMSNSKKWPEINGLNLTDGGIGNNGHIHSDEYKNHMSIKMKGRTFSNETLSKMKESQKNNTVNWRKVAQYDLNDNLIKIHASIAEASRYSGAKKPHISACLSGRQNKTKGFIFKYVTND